MTKALRVCLFDAAGLSQPSFRQSFGQISNLLILGETSTWDELREWIRHGKLDLVAINLDDEAGLGLDFVGRVTNLSPGCSLLGVSVRTDPSTIIAAMRAGCSQFVPWPIDPVDLQGAIDRIRASRQVAAHTSKRVCVLGSAGGVGATTIACNLAMEWVHLTDQASAIVDMNLEFGDVACAFDCEPHHTVADVCHDGVEVDRLLLGKAVHTLPCNVAVLSRPEDVAKAREISPEGVQHMLRVMGELYPFVVVDLPRIFSFISALAVEEANRVIVVAQLSVPSIRNAMRVRQCLLEMGANKDRVEIVLNRCEADHQRIKPKDVEAHFGKPIFAMIPNDYRHVQTSVDLGHPMLADAPKSPVRLAIQEMARKIAGEQALNDSAPADSTGFLRKLWKRSPSKG